MRFFLDGAKDEAENDALVKLSTPSLWTLWTRLFGSLNVVFFFNFIEGNGGWDEGGGGGDINRIILTWSIEACCKCGKINKFSSVKSCPRKKRFYLICQNILQTDVNALIPCWYASVVSTDQPRKKCCFFTYFCFYPGWVINWSKVNNRNDYLMACLTIVYNIHFQYRMKPIPRLEMSWPFPQ